MHVHVLVHVHVRVRVRVRVRVHVHVHVCLRVCVLCQILYEYFLGSGADTKGRAFWALSMPVGTVIQLTARFGGASAGVSWQETRFQL